MGDTLPNLKIQVQNSHQPTFIDQLIKRKKLLLIDFWNVTCNTCIAAMPKLDSLQVRYKDQVEILLVTKDSQERVDKLFSRSKIKKPNLNMITGDTLFNSYFPHDSEPHHVWLDSSKVVRYVTWGYNATAENINKFVEGEKLSIYNKEMSNQIDFRKSLMHYANSEYKQNVRGFSILLSGLHLSTDRNPFKVWSDTLDGGRKLNFVVRSVNRSILSLYSLAYSYTLYGFDRSLIAPENDNRIICPDELRYPVNLPTSDWLMQNWVSYELQQISPSKKDFLTAMQGDLDKYFSFVVSIEKRKTRCLVLKDKLRLDQKKSGKGQVRYRETTIQAMVNDMIFLNHVFKLPIVNKSKQLHNTAIFVPSNLAKFDLLMESLSEYGLELVEEILEIDMLVINPN